MNLFGKFKKKSKYFKVLQFNKMLFENREGKKGRKNGRKEKK